MYQYFFNIKKCENLLYCLSKHHEESVILLVKNNRFLSPITKRKDDHFLNLLHILEYYDKFKILKYDTYCSFIDLNTYTHFCYFDCNAYFPTLSIIILYKKKSTSKMI